MKKLCIALLTSFCAAFAALAATWKGGDGNWSDSTKWDVVPQAGDNVSIPSGTVNVGGGDIALVNSLASVNISEGATLKFSDIGPTTFVAPISGAGAFTLNKCGTSSSAPFVLSGDNGGLTGPVNLSGSYVKVTGEKALGTNNLVSNNTANGLVLDLSGKTISNSFSLSGGRGALSGSNVTILGKVTTVGNTSISGGNSAQTALLVKGGIGHSANSEKGTIIEGNIRVQGSPVTGGANSGAYPMEVYGALFLGTAVTNFYGAGTSPGRLMVDGWLYFERDECISPEMYGICLGGWLSSRGVLDLKGTRQTINKLYVWSASTANYELTSSGSPGTFVVRDTFEGNVGYLKVNGAVTMEYDSTANSPATFAFKCPVNSTSGGLCSKRGAFQLDDGITFPNLTLLKASGVGEIIVNSKGGAVPNTAALELSDSGKLTLGADAKLTVKSATINGLPVPKGSYAPGDEPFGSLLAGDSSGVLTVLQGSGKLTKYEWTGKGADAKLTTPANWVGDVAPDFENPDLVELDFATGTHAVVDGELGVYAVAISAENFVLEGADVASSLEIRKGGMHMINPNAAGYVTNTISANLKFTDPSLTTWDCCEWTFGERVHARLTGRMFGGSTTVTTVLGGAVALPSAVAAHVDVTGENDLLENALFFSNVVVQSYTEYALGSTNRYTTLLGNMERPFSFNASGTNATPLCLRGTISRMTAAGVPFVQKGAVTTYGWSNLFLEDAIFEGGIYSAQSSQSDNWMTWDFLPDANKTMTVRGKPLDVNGWHLIFEGGGTLRIESQNNKFTQLNLYARWQHLECGAENVLPSTCYLNYRTVVNNADYAHDVRLEGHDQTIQRAYPVGSVVEGNTGAYLAFLSDEPATMTFTGDGANAVSPLIFNGATRFRWSGTGTYTLCNVRSLTTNGLDVTSGTLALKWNAAFPNATNVTVSGTGVLKIDGSSAETAFGGAKSQTVLTVKDQGALDLPAGCTVAVLKVALPPTEGLAKGVYGGPDAGLDAAHTVSWITGSGRLNVRKSNYKTGFLLLMR